VTMSVQNMVEMIWSPRLPGIVSIQWLQSIQFTCNVNGCMYAFFRFVRPYNRTFGVGANQFASEPACLVNVEWFGFTRRSDKINFEFWSKQVSGLTYFKLELIAKAIKVDGHQMCPCSKRVQNGI